MSDSKLDRFTKRARRVLTLAQEEALRLNHNYIGTEHLLLGLVREENGVAVKVLRELGVEPGQVIRAVERTVGRGERAPFGKPTLAPRTKDRKSTRLNSSHQIISYAVFCLKKKRT